jgi:hypothetical protein
LALGVPLVLRFRGWVGSEPSSCRDALRWRFLGRDASSSAPDMVAFAVVVDGFLAFARAAVLDVVAGSSEAVSEVLWVSGVGCVTGGGATSSAAGVDCSGVSIDGVGGGLAMDWRLALVLGNDGTGAAGFGDSGTGAMSADARCATVVSGWTSGRELVSNCDARLEDRLEGITGASFSGSLASSTVGGGLLCRVSWVLDSFSTLSDTTCGIIVSGDSSIAG